MKKKILLLISLFCIVFYPKAQENVNISGFARTYQGITFDKGDFGIIQQTLNLNFEKIGDKVAFKVNPMIYLYNSDSLDFRLREIYVDMYFDNIDIRVGKQQIVWGKADGVFITDVVSPLNLTEFLLPDFDEIRTGIISAKFDYYVGNSTFEAIWVPQFTATELPANNSIWYIQPDFPIQPNFDWSKSKINPSLENSEIFAKYSFIGSNIDFDLMGAYTWDDNPAMHVERVFNPQTQPPSLTTLNITPQYHRIYLTGASFSTEIKGIILRGEAAYYNGKYFQTEDIYAADALTQKDYLNYVVGLDFSIGDVKLSSQFIQKYIIDYDEMMTEDETNNMATFLAHYDALRETLHLELFSYIGLSDGDALIRPKISYDFEDSYNILLGANIFVGDEAGQFGRYQNNSMVYMKIKYNF